MTDLIVIDQPKPVTDLSPKVVSMARAIDRLPPGEYSINLKKPTSKHESWNISIDEVKRVQTLTVPHNVDQGARP